MEYLQHLATILILLGMGMGIGMKGGKHTIFVYALAFIALFTFFLWVSWVGGGSIRLVCNVNEYRNPIDK